MIDEKKQAIGYIRVSTKIQATEGVSLEMQRNMIETWCNSNGHELINIFSETKSGANLKNRPEFKKAMESLESGMSFIVIKIDRFARSLVDAVMTIDKLHDEGKYFISLHENWDTTTPLGRAFMQFSAMMAELERGLIADRTRAALQHKKRNGERVGSIPYGFTVGMDGKKLILYKTEQDNITDMQDMRENGLTLNEICKQLNSEQRLTRKNKPWVYQNIQKILKIYSKTICI